MTTTSERTAIPPPPTPCRHRPTRICVKSFAIPATKDPMRKKSRLIRIIGRRPKISDRVAVVGWKTVEHSKKDVPLQKACIAVPWREDAISYSFLNKQRLQEYLERGNTGNATEILVPSRATMRVRTANAQKISRPVAVSLNVW